MSQYGSMPPPGAYVPPNQGAPAQGSQQSQASSPYQPAASNHGAPGYPHKAGGVFGQYMNQAVTTGKPMLNKLSKTISSKLGGKPPAGPPQHLQSYQNYQDHHSQHGQSQGYQQQPSQNFSPQPQQQQWGQQQQQPQGQAPNAFVPPQQSPYQQSNYATPASGHSGQSNYFPPQTSPPPNSQPQMSQRPPNTQGYETTQYSQGGNVVEQQMPAQQGQFGQAQTMQGQPQSPFQQEQHLQGQYPGQQMGVVGGIQNPPQPQNVQSPQVSNVSPEIPAQPAQWSHPLPGSGQLPPANPQGNQPYQSVHSPPIQQEQHHQWNNLAPASPQGFGQSPGQLPPHSISPPPLQQSNIPPQIPTNKPSQTQPPTPASQHTAPQPESTAFIAELPADIGNLSIMESKPLVHDQSAQASQYQAYHPAGSQTGSPSPGFTIPRRSVSTSSFPVADPWRIADPVTELPTREFYIVADLIYDALDRKFEPNNTGLLEAPKVLGTWMTLTEDARLLFSYKSYSALAKLWSLEGIPHIMVPSQPALTPNWNFNQHSHAQDLKVIAEPLTSTSTYATYIPAINRAGWYKFFFLETMQAPDVIGDLLRGLCPDTYKPGVLNHPDVNRRDRSEIPALQARASEIQSTAFKRVCDETKSAMTADHNLGA